MSLFLIHIIALVLFILLTAFEGVFMIPFFSFSGIGFLMMSPDASMLPKIAFVLAGLFCIFIFVKGYEQRASWKGKLINVGSVYLWCLAGYFALYFING